MKAICSRPVIGFMLVLGFVLCIAAACSKQKPGATQGTNREGFNQSSLPLLRRVSAGEPDAVSSRLVEKLCPAPCPPPKIQNPGDRIDVTGDSWSLHVIGNGTAAQFQDLAVAKRAHSLATDASQKMSAAALERAGRAYLTGPLSSVIVIGPGEELVAGRIDYRTEGSQNIKTGEIARFIVANRIVFGRTVRQVPIVGGGSTVVLTFANDGTLESFRYDWPKYQIEDMRPVIKRDEILDRVQRVISLRMGVPTSTPVARSPETATSSVGVELGRNTQLQGLECGYYDSGFATRQGSAPVQPGCVYHVVTKSEDGVRAGFAGAVPGAARVELDPSWPEVDLLRGSRTDANPIVPTPAGNANAHKREK